MSRTYEQLEPVIMALDDRIKTNLGAFPTDTAEGSIASFPDGADDIPLKSLVVNIDPVQDLHGYDSPWPAGGGVNKIDVSALRTHGAVFGLLTSFDGDWIVISGTYTKAEAVATYRIANMIDSSVLPSTKFRAFPDSNSANHISANSFGLADGNKTLTIYLANMVQGETYNLRTKIVGYEGDTPPTAWSPYSNICPISGWTGANVMTCGKNLLDPNTATLYNSTVYGLTLAWDTTTGAFTISGTYTGANSGTVFRAITVPSAIRAYNVVGFSTSPNFNKMEWQINEDVIVCKLKNLVQNTAYNIVAYPVVYEGSTAPTDYESFKGTSIPISWQTEAGTVYGGSLDVLSGVLTVYPYYASYNGETLTGRWISDRDVYAVGTAPTIGAQVVNIGAQGTEIQLSPHEVRSLLGQNNIFADTGDSTVEYRADTKLYIERLTEPDADMIADSNIVSGQYFMVGNSLYLATANIASGSAVIVGTNCTQKSLATALNEINQ